MLADASIVADRQWGRIHEGKTATGAQAGLQVRTERANRARHQLHEALITDGLGKFAVQMAKHIGQLIGLEIAKAHLMEIDHNGHDFAHGELA